MDLAQFWEARTKKSRSQLQTYVDAKSPEPILKFIRMGGGTAMGTAAEEYARFHFASLKPRKKGRGETGHDHLINDLKVEQKSSGYWGKGDFKWQHIAMGHDWKMLLLAGIQYENFAFWALSKRDLERLLSEGTLKNPNQGSKDGSSSQGIWFCYSEIKNHIPKIESDEHLVKFALACVC